MSEQLVAAVSMSSSGAIFAFVGYTVVVLALAWLSHRVRSGRAFLNEYYLGSRGLTVLAFTFTFGATSASAGSFAGVPSLIYAHGWSVALWISSYMVVPLCALGLLGKRLNQISRKTGAITLPDILRERFKSPRIAILSSLLLVFLLSLYLIPQFKLASLILNQLLSGSGILNVLSGWLKSLQTEIGFGENLNTEYLVCLVFFSALVVIYTTFGGFRAVVWTDVLQGFIMLAGIIVLLFLTLQQSGGLAAATTLVGQQVPPRLGYVQFVTDQVRTDAVVIPSESWFELSSQDGQIKYYCTNETAIITPRKPESTRIKAVEFSSAEWLKDYLSDSVVPLPEHVSPVLGEFEAYAFGANEQESYLRCPGPSPVNPVGFLSLGLAISIFVYWPISGTGQPGNMVRLMAFRSSLTLKRSIILLSFYFGFIYFALIIVFCSARAIVPGLDHTPDRIMPVLSFHLSEVARMPWLAGLLVAAPFAAAMSTVDSFMLMISSSVVRDIYQRNYNPAISEKQIKRLSYLCMILIGIVVTAGAANPPRFMQYLIVFTGGGLSVSFLIPMAMALYWPRSTAKGATAAMISGFLVYLSLYVAGYIINHSPQPLNLLQLDPLIWGFVASIVAGILGSWVDGPPSEELVAKFFHA